MCNCNAGEEKNIVVNGNVADMKLLAKDIYKMTIDGEALAGICARAKAGQFINIYLRDKSTLLPRPISICKIDKRSLDIVFKVVGKGTKALSMYGAGDEIRISNGLGNGFITVGNNEKSGDEHIKKAVLVGGGVGIPPLIQLAKELKAVGTGVTAVFGFQEELYLVEEMKKYCKHVYVATESGSSGFQGNVVQLIKEMGILGDEFYSCGPKPMLKALAEYCQQIQVPIQVSLEERMGCGYGACVGCTCKILAGENIVQKAVCKDGPVFMGSEVVWNE